MATPRAQDEGEGLIGLVRDTADGLGRLIADHIKLARVEMAADAKAYSRRVGLVALAGGVLLIGYLFACIAGALALGRVIGGPLAFLAFGSAHLVLGLIVLWAVVRRLGQPSVLDDTMSQVGRSVATLKAQVTGLDGHPPKMS